VSRTVVVAGVEQGDAVVEGGMDGGDALALIRRTVHPGHAHAAECEWKDCGAHRAQLAGLTVCC
jgi:hypothetical protein